MTARNSTVYLEDILESIEHIQRYLVGISKESFLQNSEKQDAVLRRLEIIGEAVKNLPMELRKAHPAIPWRPVAGLRDVIIHEYFRVVLERVWTVIDKDLRLLKRVVTEMLDH